MKQKRIVVLFFFLLFNHYFATAQSKVTAIHAKPFYNETRDYATTDTGVGGTFSENIIGDDDFVLWNTIIGEGSAKGYSNQTIVIVSVTSKDAVNKSQLLRFTATEGKRVIQQQQQTFSCLGKNTTYQLLFLLNNTGCEMIKVKAELLKNRKSVSTLSKTIEFRCGE
jgi:hypothetical protein